MQNVLLLSDEQSALQETAAAFLAEFANARKPRDEDGALWRRIAELGWPAVQVPEALGGLGMGPVELALLTEEMGRRLTRSPFFASVVLAQTALMEVGDAAAQERHLPALAAGDANATLILAPGCVWSPDELSITGRRDGDGWVLSGEAHQVIDDGSCDMAFVAARHADGVALFHVPADAPGVERIPLDVWDLTRPQMAWRLRDQHLPPDARLDAPDRLDAGLARTVSHAALQLAAEQVGGAAACLEMTVAYARERVQFGKPVASFQAVKHRCAEMMVRLESARSAVRGVAAIAAGLANADELAREVAVARVLANDAYRFCAQEAVQLHGGVGFTWEYDPQLHFKRAQWGSQWFGAAARWRERVATHLLDFA